MHGVWSGPLFARMFLALLLACAVSGCGGRKAEPLPPGTVVLALGGNDMLRKTPEPETVDNLGKPGYVR